jgi:hypothetical protein
MKTRSVLIASCTAFLACLPFFSRAGAITTVGFTENKGQFADQDGKPVPQLMFRGSVNHGPGVFITTSGLTYIFTEGAQVRGEDAEPVLRSRAWSRIDMKLEGAEIRPENVIMDEPVAGCSNYYLAHCPQGILGVKTWRRITVTGVYPGIDWVIYMNAKNEMEYDFIVHPGADPERIRVSYPGADHLELGPGNSMISLCSRNGKVTEGQLYTYQKEDGKQVEAVYRHYRNQVSFSVGNYDRSSTLVIDPPLQWSALQTGSGLEYAYAIAVAKDGSGNTCLTGYTDSPDFPVLNAYQGSNAGQEDIVVERLDATGTRVWSTYYGGTNIEGGKSIDTDVNGNCYVTGYTGSNNMPTLNPVQGTFAGGTYDVAILKFNAAGVRQWATYYGGLQTDYGSGIVEDNTGIYITGYTSSGAFPVVNSSTTKSTGYDAFVMKMSLNQAVRFARFFGGNDDDKGRAIALNASGADVYITGSTLSGVPISTTGVFQPINASAFVAEDAFITEFDTTGNTVVFSTFCGGSDADFGQGIAVDPSGNVFITGYTLSPDFPIKNPGGSAYVDSSQGSPGTHDAFVVKCNPSGTTQLWGTYLGGSAVDMGMDIAWNSTFGIFVTGSAQSTDFPVLLPSDNVFFQSTQGDGGSFNDMFITWFYTDLSWQWSSYYGGAGGDEGHSIATDASGNIYVAGLYFNDAVALKFGPGVLNGMEEQGKDAPFMLYPLPVSGVLNFQGCIALAGRTAEVYNALGEQVLSAGISGNSIDVSMLAPGLYQVRITGLTVTKKFIKQ